CARTDGYFPLLDYW
nr:immunoglobulin heavy chain junction region [Mus musculus]